MKALSDRDLREALEFFDTALDRSLTVYLAGTGAMVLGHGMSVDTSDIHAIPKGEEPTVLVDAIRATAENKKLQANWMNLVYANFPQVLPTDVESRAREVFKGKKMTALVLGVQDLLLLKCFTHRPLDMGHSVALIKKGAQVKAVEAHLEGLTQRGVPGAQRALDFLDEVVDQT